MDRDFIVYSGFSILASVKILRVNHDETGVL